VASLTRRAIRLRPHGLCDGARVAEVADPPGATLGIDLAVDPRRTAACAIAWRDGRAAVESISVGLDDAALRAAIAAAHARGGWAGIDAPFAWPERFRDAVVAHHRDRTWPADYRDPRLRYRATDRFVEHECRRRPLSVSTDLIGVTAMRCARMLQEVGEDRGGPIDPAGADGVVEVYPAAALLAWRLDPRGYKNGPLARANRRRLVDALAARPWLAFGGDAAAACERSDHALDALLAALATRAAQRGLTHRPRTDDERALAPSEGWIHVPVPGSLDRLVGP
jgi:predicted nuclease with RNAse H fold